MCLGVPGRVLEVRGRTAIVDFWGVRRETRLDVVDEAVEPGDYILNHVGFAIRRIPPGEIAETLALYEQLLGGDPADMMTADVLGEMDATGDGLVVETAPACPVIGIGLGAMMQRAEPEGV